MNSNNLNIEYVYLRNINMELLYDIVSQNINFAKKQIPWSEKCKVGSTKNLIKVKGFNVIRS